MPLRQTDIERLVRLETDMRWLKQESKNQSSIIGKTSDDVTEIKIMISQEKGKKQAIKYMAHLASVLGGGLAGFFAGFK